MKVLALNGSSNAKGVTYTAMNLVGERALAHLYNELDSPAKYRQIRPDGRWFRLLCRWWHSDGFCGTACSWSQGMLRYCSLPQSRCYQYISTIKQLFYLRLPPLPAEIASCPFVCDNRMGKGVLCGVNDLQQPGHIAAQHLHGLYAFEELAKEGIEMEIVHVGAKGVQGCTNCKQCRKTHHCSSGLCLDINYTWEYYKFNKYLLSKIKCCKNILQH